MFRFKIASVFILLFMLSAFKGFAAESSHKADNGEAPGFGFGSPGFESAGFIYRQYFGRLGISGGFGGHWSGNDHGKIGIAATFLVTLQHLHFSPRRLPNSSLRINLPIGASFALERSYHGLENKAGNLYAPSLSIGLGVEYFFNQHVALHLETPWTTSLRIKNSKSSFHVNFMPNGGVVFYF